MQTRSSRTLLACGIVAGPLYVILGLLQIAIRPGFDVRRHALSLLSNGALGWIQNVNFLITGALVVTGAAGLARTLGAGPGKKWAPRMLGLYGLGLIGAAIFSADPALGFPPGTPASNTPISWHGMMHVIVGTTGFVGFIAACLIFARRFASEGRREWSIFSAATGVLFLAAFIGIASGSSGPVSLYFALAVALGFTWLSLSLMEVRRTTRA